MTPELADLLDEMEIQVVQAHDYRGPRCTMAVHSMEKILRRHGYAHLKIVLMSIVDTTNNRRELIGPVMLGISDVIRAHPEWAERADAWFKAIDKIRLGTLWEQAKANRKAVRPRAAIATKLFDRLYPVFTRQGELSL